MPIRKYLLTTTLLGSSLLLSACGGNVSTSMVVDIIGDDPIVTIADNDNNGILTQEELVNLWGSMDASQRESVAASLGVSVEFIEDIVAGNVGLTTETIEVIKEVIVEVPVEVIKEVIVEVPVEGTGETIIETVEVIKEVIVEVPGETIEIIKEVIVEVPGETIEVIKEVEVIVEVPAEVDEDQILYDGIYTANVNAGKTSYEAAAYAALTTLHSQGVTGSGIHVTVVDDFDLNSHGEDTGNIIENISPGASDGLGTWWTDTGTLSASDIFTTIAGIEGINVVNISLGGYDITEAEFNYNINYVNAYFSDALYVISAGNDGDSGRNCAGAADCNDIALSIVGGGKDAIVVGALEADGLSLADYSTEAGVLADYYISAPVLFSELPGTSFAAPVVSGTAALIMDKFETNASETIDIIFSTADDLGNPGVDAVYGNGALNIGKALSPVGNLK